MLGMKEYADAFKKGMNYVLYDSDIEDRMEPILDLSDFVSIGYYDGYTYGEYLEQTGQTMSTSQEQLIAVIDKYHTQALKRYSQLEKESEEIGKSR